MRWRASRPRTKPANFFSLKAEGLLTDDLKWNNMNSIGSKENYNASTSSNKVVRESVLMRLNYNYKSRYYFTFTGRYDGSSNFAENNKWGFFPSAAVKWNAKNENFLKQVSWLDERRAPERPDARVIDAIRRPTVRSKPTARPPTVICSAARSRRRSSLRVWPIPT